MSVIHALNAIDAIKPGTMLDVGARNAATSRYFAKRGYKVHAIDPAPIKPIILAEDITFENITLEDYQPKQKFDLVVASLISHLVPYDTYELIERLAFCAKTGGLIYVTLIGENDDWSCNPKAKAVTEYVARECIDNAGLKIIYQANESFDGKLYDGSDKFWNLLKYVLKK